MAKCSSCEADKTAENCWCFYTDEKTKTNVSNIVFAIVWPGFSPILSLGLQLNLSIYAIIALIIRRSYIPC